MSFFLVKLLQSFSEFSLAGDVQPENSKTSKSWVQGSSDWNLTFKVNLTMSVKVRQIIFLVNSLSKMISGWNVGPYEVIDIFVALDTLHTTSALIKR
jgi:hypothetical protein